MSFCPHCGAPAPSSGVYCASCGRVLGAAPATLPAPAPAPTTWSPPPSAPPVEQGMAIASLILNIIVWPGLGTLVAGARVGWAQGFLCLGGLLLTLTLVGAIVGIPMMIAAWIWALVSSIHMLTGKPA